MKISSFVESVDFLVPSIDVGCCIRLLLNWVNHHWRQCIAVLEQSEILYGKKLSFLSMGRMEKNRHFLSFYNKNLIKLHQTFYFMLSCTHFLLYYHRPSFLPQFIFSTSVHLFYLSSPFLKRTSPNNAKKNISCDELKHIKSKSNEKYLLKILHTFHIQFFI